MNIHKTQREGVTCLFDRADELVGLIHLDTKTHHKLFYKCEQMSMEELEMLTGSDIIKTKSNELEKEG